MNEKYICTIEPGLFLGSWHATKKQTLQHYHIKHVYHIGFSLSEEETLPDISYHWIELDDNTQSAHQLPCLFDKVIPTMIRENGNTLVCCSMGKSRSPSFIMAYLHTKYPDMTYQYALDLIRSKRNIHINPGFTQLLQQMFST